MWISLSLAAGRRKTLAGLTHKEDRLSRILRLGAMLRQHSGALGVDVICERFKISRRTFYRDIRLLRNAGARVTYRADTGAYEAELFSSIVGESLSTREAAAVKAALAGARPRRGSEFEGALDIARGKMAEIISEQFKEHAGVVEQLAKLFVGEQSDQS